MSESEIASVGTLDRVDVLFGDALYFRIGDAFQFTLDHLVADFLCLGGSVVFKIFCKTIIPPDSPKYKDIFRPLERESRGQRFKITHLPTFFSNEKS